MPIIYNESQKFNIDNRDISTHSITVSHIQNSSHKISLINCNETSNTNNKITKIEKNNTKSCFNEDISKVTPFSVVLVRDPEIEKNWCKTHCVYRCICLTVIPEIGTENIKSREETVIDEENQLKLKQPEISVNKFVSESDQINEILDDVVEKEKYTVNKTDHNIVRKTTLEHTPINTAAVEQHDVQEIRESIEDIESSAESANENFSTARLRVVNAKKFLIQNRGTRELIKKEIIKTELRTPRLSQLLKYRIKKCGLYATMKTRNKYLEIVNSCDGKFVPKNLPFNDIFSINLESEDFSKATNKTNCGTEAPPLHNNNMNLQRETEEMNIIVTKTMKNICHMQMTTILLSEPKLNALNIFKWDYLVDAFRNEQIFVWSVRKYIGNNQFFVITKLNVMPHVPNAISVVNLKTLSPSTLPLLAKMLKLHINNEGTKTMAVLLLGEIKYWWLIGFIHSENNYLNNGIIGKPTIESHPFLVKKISLLHKNLHEKNIFTKLNPSNIFVKLPVIPPNFRWFMLYVYDDFSDIYMPSWQSFLKYERIINTLNLSNSTKKSIRMTGSDINLLPHVYATPTSKDRIFIGPYKIDENVDFLLCQQLDGRMLMREVYERVLGITRENHTTGCWLYIKTDKIDEPSSSGPKNDLSKSFFTERTMDDNEVQFVSDNPFPSPIPIVSPIIKKPTDILIEDGDLPLLLPKQSSGSKIENLCTTEKLPTIPKALEISLIPRKSLPTENKKKPVKPNVTTIIPLLDKSKKQNLSHDRTDKPIEIIVLDDLEDTPKLPQSTPKVKKLCKGPSLSPMPSIKKREEPSNVTAIIPRLDKSKERNFSHDRTDKPIEIINLDGLEDTLKLFKSTPELKELSLCKGPSLSPMTSIKKREEPPKVMAKDDKNSKKIVYVHLKKVSKLKGVIIKNKILLQPKDISNATTVNSNETQEKPVNNNEPVAETSMNILDKPFSRKEYKEEIMNALRKIKKTTVSVNCNNDFPLDDSLAMLKISNIVGFVYCNISGVGSIACEIRDSIYFIKPLNSSGHITNLCNYLTQVVRKRVFAFCPSNLQILWRFSRQVFAASNILDLEQSHVITAYGVYNLKSSTVMSNIRIELGYEIELMYFAWTFLEKLGIDEDEQFILENGINEIKRLKKESEYTFASKENYTTQLARNQIKYNILKMKMTKLHPEISEINNQPISYVDITNSDSDSDVMPIMIVEEEQDDF